MFTTKDFAGLTKGMSEKEVEAIKQGKLIVGMSGPRWWPPMVFRRNTSRRA